MMNYKTVVDVKVNVLIIHECLWINACHSHHCDLIQEESKTMQKETNKNIENLKDQVIKVKDRHEPKIEKNENWIWGDTSGK